MEFKYRNNYKEISVSNPFDNVIEIQINCDGEEYIQLDMDKDEERKALDDLAGYIKHMLYQRMQKHFENLGYKKPGPNAVTVGDLIGLKRED